jgi:DNA helicase-2/ATP-dependent DNA helicase PcrA
MDAMFHATAAWTFAELRKRGVAHPSVAILCRSNGFVAILSEILQTQHTVQGRLFRPIEHGVVWDAELAVAAAVTVASIMQWSSDDATYLTQTLSLLARYYQLKNAERLTKTAAASALKYAQIAEAVAAGQTVRSKSLQCFRDAFAVGGGLIGDPIRDWLAARRVLQSIKGLDDVFSDASMVRLFGAREALASGLAELWLATGSYRGAAERVRAILRRQRLLETERVPRGCLLMTIHKSKGKEFDGVVLVEGSHRSPFLDTVREQPPFERSRRLLRVGLTRARHFVAIVRPVGATPLVG